MTLEQESQCRITAVIFAAPDRPRPVSRLVRDQEHATGRRVVCVQVIGRIQIVRPHVRDLAGKRPRHGLILVVLHNVSGLGLRSSGLEARDLGANQEIKTRQDPSNDVDHVRGRRIGANRDNYGQNSKRSQ